MIEFFIIIGLFFYNFFPTTSITLRFTLLLVFLFACLFQKRFHTVNNIRKLIFISIVTIFLILYHGLAVGKDFFIFCFGILSTSYFAKKHSFTNNIIYKYLFYVIIPLSIFNFLLYHNVFYLPFTTGHVNIIGKDATKHGTAIIGTLLFIGASFNLIKSKNNLPKKDIIFLIIGIYFVVFSGSRSCVLAIITTIFIYIINRKKYNKTITSICFIAIISSVFFLEYLQEYVHLIKDDFILDFIGAKNFKQHGVTSGRAWLWDYHWDSFINSPYLLGGGRAVIDFRVGDYIPTLRIRALAGSESPYTRIIACNGIIGFFQLGILLYLSYKAIKKENLYATCLIFIIIHNTTMGVDFTNVIGANPIMIYLLYFTSFKNKNLITEE